jgi:hypothetical protein
MTSQIHRLYDDMMLTCSRSQESARKMLSLVVEMDSNNQFGFLECQSILASCLLAGKIAEMEVEDPIRWVEHRDNPHFYDVDHVNRKYHQPRSLTDWRMSRSFALELKSDVEWARKYPSGLDLELSGQNNAFINDVFPKLKLLLKHDVMLVP